MLGWSCQEPHPPFVCPEPFFSMYDADDMVLPDSRRDRHTVEYLKARMGENRTCIWLYGKRNEDQAAESDWERTN